MTSLVCIWGGVEIKEAYLGSSKIYPTKSYTKYCCVVGYSTTDYVVTWDIDNNENPKVIRTSTRGGTKSFAHPLGYIIMTNIKTGSWEYQDPETGTIIYQGQDNNLISTSCSLSYDLTKLYATDTVSYDTIRYNITATGLVRDPSYSFTLADYPNDRGTVSGYYACYVSKTNQQIVNLETKRVVGSFGDASTLTYATGNNDYFLMSGKTLLLAPSLSASSVPKLSSSDINFVIYNAIVTTHGKNTTYTIRSIPNFTILFSGSLPSTGGTGTDYGGWLIDGSVSFGAIYSRDNEKTYMLKYDGNTPTVAVIDNMPVDQYSPNIEYSSVIMI